MMNWLERVRVAQGYWPWILAHVALARRAP